MKVIIILLSLINAYFSITEAPQQTPGAKPLLPITTEIIDSLDRIANEVQYEDPDIPDIFSVASEHHDDYSIISGLIYPDFRKSEGFNIEYLKSKIMKHLKSIIKEKTGIVFGKIPWNKLSGVVIGWPEEVPLVVVDSLPRASVDRIYENLDHITISDNAFALLLPKELDRKRYFLSNAMLKQFNLQSGLNIDYIPWSEYLSPGGVTGWPRGVRMRVLSKMTDQNIMTLISHIKNIRFTDQFIQHVRKKYVLNG